METLKQFYTFGPVPSRRLGRSLGINNIPAKICTYTCIYCQIGKTLKMQVKREGFFKPEEIANEVELKIGETEKSGETIDYLSFVPDGEPTLDKNLGIHLEYLKRFKIKTAVITNSSLMGERGVREDLSRADWVSVKVDAIDDSVWRKIDRPHRSLKLESINEGLLEFSRNYRGKLVTETMLVAGINDSETELEKIANFITQLKPDTAYISIPTRPPAEKWVEPPNEDRINKAYLVFKERAINTELLIGYEGNAFATTGDVEKDILSITSVHPMREDAIEEYLKKTGANWESIEKLIREGFLIRLTYNGKNFYLRKLKKKFK